jgi:translocation and assembly module TamB
MLTRTALIMVLFLAFSAQLLAAEPVVVRVEGVEGGLRKKVAAFPLRRGERFQAVHLPELQLMVNPELTFVGNLEKFSARGLIRIPEMQVNSRTSSTVIRPSRDVVVMGREAAPSGAAGTALDLQLRLLLGDKVNVKSEGLDARLEGGITLRLTGPATATGSGEIRVAKGSYSIYGVNLDIKRGRAIFSGGPVERPTLDILALREVDEIKAGVAVTGTPEMSLIKLYSEPALPDTDILAYVVLGHKLGENGDQAALLMQAASLLGSSGQSKGVQERIKELVRLDTITVTSSKERSSGYKPIEPSLRATSQSRKESAGVSQTMLQLGKYLTHKLYVSYGRSLFAESQELRARYTVSKKWEVESRVSPEGTGGDIFYRIELE